MNLSGSNIQDTYQRVLHTDGASITDGTGSEVLSAAELTTLQTIGSANIDSTEWLEIANICLLYTSPSPRDRTRSRMPSSA